MPFAAQRSHARRGRSTRWSGAARPPLPGRLRVPPPRRCRRSMRLDATALAALPRPPADVGGSAARARRRGPAPGAHAHRDRGAQRPEPRAAASSSATTSPGARPEGPCIVEEPYCSTLGLPGQARGARRQRQPPVCARRELGHHRSRRRGTFTYEVDPGPPRFYCEEMMADLPEDLRGRPSSGRRRLRDRVTDAAGACRPVERTPGHYNSIPSAVKGMLARSRPSGRARATCRSRTTRGLAGHMPDIAVDDADLRRRRRAARLRGDDRATTSTWAAATRAARRRTRPTSSRTGLQIPPL